MAKAEEWEWSDAWVLTAALNCGNPVTLEDLVSVGDMINHAIFNYEEIAPAIDRFERAGLMERNGGKWNLYPAIRASFEPVRRLGFYEQVGAVLERLREIPLQQAPATDRPFSEDDYRSAVARNHARWHRFPCGCLFGVVTALLMVVLHQCLRE
jgi:hypothetical protein